MSILSRVSWAIGLLLLARAAGAQPEPEAPPPVPLDPPEIDLDAVPQRFITKTPWAKLPYAVEGHAALGGPLGLLGVALDVSTSEELSVGFGVGISEATRTPQTALLLRARLLLTRTFATGAEGSLGVGNYADDIECSGSRCPPSYSWNPAFWSTLGLFLEYRGDDGTTFRAGFGAGAIMNVADARCERCGAEDEPSMWVTAVPYAGIAAGRAFSW
ncbi:MAG: hypothetical protein R3B13_11235 [Polyangiaceae bacterium]